MNRSLAGFTGAGYDKGRSRFVQALWFAMLNLVFYKWWCPARVGDLPVRLYIAMLSSWQWK